MNAIIFSQFNDYPVIWMLHDRKVNKRNKKKSMKEQERFSHISPKKSTVAIYEKLKDQNDVNLNFMSEVFVEKKISYRLSRNGNK